MARMTLPDFVAELKGRGFDGFEVNELTRYINFGYLTVGRLTKWAWEETTIPMVMSVGQYRWSLQTDLPTVKSIKSVNGITAGYERRLDAISTEEFYTSWASQNLASGQSRGEPDRYFLDAAYLYVLPPPTIVRNFTVLAEQILPELITGGNETPITPQEYDEAILIAAEEHCHIRARQPQFAEVNRKKLMEFFDDALADESSRMQDQQSRVIAGRTCL